MLITIIIGVKIYHGGKYKINIPEPWMMVVGITMPKL
jgi:hypothetical protein